MTRLSAGDIVFSFAETLIRATGVVQGAAYESPKPDFKAAGSNWSNIGWFAEVEFVPIQKPIAPKNHMDLIGPLLNQVYAPLQQSGKGNQGVYLTEVSRELGELLIELSHISMDFIWSAAAPFSNLDDTETERMVESDESALEKVQLIKARRGQGLFKANVRLIERRCRVTGLETPRHLIASHIKPWAASNDAEKLDGANGLLLSPHIDHLFDKGFISFGDRGNVIVSNELDPSVLNQWNLNLSANVGEFESRQCKYLEYHRDEVFID